MTRQVYLQNIDIYIRLTILEGNAGVTVGSWSRNPNLGLGLAKQHFGDTIDAQWFDPSGLPFLTLFQSILVKLEFTKEDVDDTIADLLLNPNFYTLGQKCKVLNKKDSFKHILFEASRFAYHKVLTKERQRQTIRFDSNVWSRDTTWDRLTENPKIWLWLRQFWAEHYHAQPSVLKVLDLKLSNPSRKCKEISAFLGKGRLRKSPDKVSRTLLKAFAAARQAVENGTAPTHILDFLGEIL